MSRTWQITAGLLILALCGLLLSCGPGNVEPTAVVPTALAPTAAAPAGGAALPNPAAAYCQEQGYGYEIRTAADGSQSGVCILPDGTECDEWALYRGECGPAPAAGAGAAPAVWLDKTAFAPEEEVQVHFLAPSPLREGAWVGLIPSEVPHGSEATNDEEDLAHQYLDGQTEGVLLFPAPARPGAYDFRLHDADEDGQELASVSFVVAGGALQAELTLDKATFAPGEEIQLRFAVPDGYPDDAWVGLIPSDVAHGSAQTNDEYDMDYYYLDGKVSGVLAFFAPDNPGSYDFRLHDSSAGLEVASITFEVSGD